MHKFEIVNALLRKNNCRSYLEICTPSTGGKFTRIDKTQLRVYHRLMYRCPRDFEDGEEITFRSEGDGLQHQLDPAMPYDLVFVDPFHTFECSMRDLQAAHSVGSVIVVHDCCPPHRDLVSPSFHPGSWCGVTYRAYIEFVLSHPDVSYCTVDTDYGCGVIKKDPEQESIRAESYRELLELWSFAKERNPDMFEFFFQHRDRFLKLISVEDFLSREGIQRSSAARLWWKVCNSPHTMAAILRRTLNA